MERRDTEARNFISEKTGLQRISGIITKFQQINVIEIEN